MNHKCQTVLFISGILICLSFCLLACSQQQNTDNNYPTALNEAPPTLFQTTSSAVVDDYKTTAKQDVIEAARVFLQTTRISYDAPPEVIGVEYTTLELTQKTIDPNNRGTSYSEKAGNTEIWFIQFKGYGVISSPPDLLQEFIPEAPTELCSYVLVDPESGTGYGAGSFECPGEP